jgi:hypothetical protein
VLTGVWPLTAVGVQLDTLGRIVGQTRQGLADAAYRLFIVGRIFVNKADGRWPEFFELLDILGYTETMAGYEYWPAAFELASTSVDYPTQAGDLLFDMKPAGVVLHWVNTGYADTDVFKCSSQLGVDETDADEGTENLIGTTGGRLPSMRWSS